MDNYIFTHLFYRNNYRNPVEFCYEIKACEYYAPVVDNPYSREYNVDQLSDDFYNYFKKMSLEFRSNHLMHPFGSDFFYEDARSWYINLDAIVILFNCLCALWTLNALHTLLAVSMPSMPCTHSA